MTCGQRESVPLSPFQPVFFECRISTRVEQSLVSGTALSSATVMNISFVLSLFLSLPSKMSQWVKSKPDY